MAHRAIPLDQETGLPLPIVGESRSPDITNFHHPWFPRRNPELFHEHPVHVKALDIESLSTKDLSGLALRMSFGQITPYDIHIEAHRRNDGPEIPATVADKFQATVKGCSRVVPRMALWVGGSRCGQVIRLDDDAYERVSRNVMPEYHYYHYDKDLKRTVVSDFLVRFALTQGFSGGPDKVIERFLNTTDDALRKELGNLLLKEALHATVAPLYPQHAELKEKGLVRIGAPHILSAVRKQVVPHRLPLYRNYLADRLAVTA